MAVPTYQGFNAADQGAGSLITVAPYSGTTNGDIIINYVMSKFAYPDAPGNLTGYTSGETKIRQIYHSYLFSTAIFWYRVSGSPPASMSYVHAYSGCPLGVISLTFRGCVASGTPYDFEIAEAGATSSTWYATSGTTVGADRLLVSGQVAAADGNIYFGGSYYGVTDQGDIGTYFYGALMTRSQASAGSTPADSGSMFNSVSRMGLTFALASPPPPGYGNDVLGVASANIGKVKGVATANVSKVIGV